MAEDAPPEPVPLAQALANANLAQADAEDEHTPVPVTLITGFLGSGERDCVCLRVWLCVFMCAQP